MFETVIGLEVHVQLNTKTKLFCSCPTSFAEHQNSNTCPTCLALPGALPVANKEAAIKAMRFGYAINADVNQPIDFYWLASDLSGHYYDNYCRSWTQALEDYRYHPRLLTDTESGTTDFSSLAEDIAARLDGLAGYDLYVAGSAPMESAFSRVFQQWNLPEERMFIANLRRKWRVSSGYSRSAL